MDKCFFELILFENDSYYKIPLEIVISEQCFFGNHDIVHRRLTFVLFLAPSYFVFDFNSELLTIELNKINLF